MKKYIYISCAGFIGAILRVMIKNINIYNDTMNIPINTLFINVIGSFLLALFLTLSLDLFEIELDIRLGVATGFLGAFTTFSTLCKEAFMLIQNEYYFSAISYVVVSVILGLAFAYLGVMLANEYIIKILKAKLQNEKNNDSFDIDNVEGEAE